VTTTASERAMGRAFLQLLGATYSSRMAYAIVAWVRAETGRTIIGNNPWNQHHGPACSPATLANVKVGGKRIPHSHYLKPDPTFPGLIGNRWAGPSDTNVAIYATIADGMRQSAENLLRGQHDTWTGYWPVVLAARSNDPKGFMDALAASKWAADKYGTKNGGQNRIVKIYREIVAGLGSWYSVDA
jgi:hypothetical protein